MSGTEQNITTNIKTVNGSSLLGSGDLQVGTILGTLPATAGLIPFANGTSNTVTTNSALSFISNKLNIGTGTPMAALDLNISRSLAGVVASVGMSITNTDTTGVSGINIGESTTNRFALIRFGSTSSSVVTGTSLNYQNTTVIASSSGVSFGSGNLYIIGNPIINIVGSIATNMGTRLDATGLRIGQINTLHTTNSAVLDIADSNTTRASLRLRAGVAPTTPNDGDIWFDGANLKMRVGGVTKTFTLT